MIDRHCAIKPEIVISDAVCSQTVGQIPEERIAVKNIRAVHDSADIALCRLAIIACACVADTTVDIVVNRPDLRGHFSHQETVRDQIILPRYLWYNHDFDSQKILASSLLGPFEGSVDWKLRLVWGMAAVDFEAGVSQLHVAWGDRKQSLEHSGPKEVYVCPPEYIPGHYRQELDPVVSAGLDQLNHQLSHMLRILR
jgi:hypothetical protein